MRVLSAAAVALVVLAGPALAQDIVFGTGVFLNQSGDVLTNRHVVERCPSLFVKSASGQSFPATVLVRSRTLDMAVLRATGFMPFEFAWIATGANRPATIATAGDRVVYGGYDNGMAFMNLAEGAVVEPPPDLAIGARVSVMTSDASHGASGSGVFEEGRGALVGLIFARYLNAGEREPAPGEPDLPNASRLTKFYTAETIVGFLQQEAKIHFSQTANPDPRSWADTRAHIYRATALVLCGK